MKDSDLFPEGSLQSCQVQQIKTRDVLLSWNILILKTHLFIRNAVLPGPPVFIHAALSVGPQKGDKQITWSDLHPRRLQGEGKRVDDEEGPALSKPQEQRSPAENKDASSCHLPPRPGRRPRGVPQPMQPRAGDCRRGRPQLGMPASGRVCCLLGPQHFVCGAKGSGRQKTWSLRAILFLPSWALHPSPL